jgi:multisubunit Na+/H+ antiporter MnhB subunit
MEVALAIIIGVMILGALFAIHAKDLLSAVITCGIIGYGLVICFLLIRAPDLAIVQIVADTITLIIMVAVVLNSSREEKYSHMDTRNYISAILGIIIVLVLFYFFYQATRNLLVTVHSGWLMLTLKGLLKKQEVLTWSRV